MAAQNIWSSPVISVFVVDGDVKNWMNISDGKFQASIPGRRDRLVLRVGLPPAVVQLQHHERVALTALKHQ